MKKCAVLLSLCFMIVTGCPLETDSNVPLGTLSGTSWNCAEDSLYFVSENRVQAANDFKEYTYSNKSGSVTILGNFTVSDNSEALTFPAYMGGSQVSFTRLENFSPGRDMVNTKWAFASISLKFTSATHAAMGGHTYAYLYNDAEKSGILENLGSFTYDDEAQTITFSNYLGGAQLTFQTELDGVLVGSKWRWGNSLLEFTKPNKVNLRNKTYTYVYESLENAGNISGIGDFSISGDDGRTLSFREYKKDLGADYGFAVDFNEQLDDTTVTMATTLAGTEWYWDSVYGGYLIFLTDTKIAGSARTFAYNPSARTGTMDVFGAFLVTNNDTHITFTNIKGYGHTAEFGLVE